MLWSTTRPVQEPVASPVHTPVSRIGKDGELGAEAGAQPLMYHSPVMPVVYVGTRLELLGLAGVELGMQVTLPLIRGQQNVEPINKMPG